AAPDAGGPSVVAASWHKAGAGELQAVRRGKDLEGLLKRVVAVLLGSPFLIVADIGLAAGLALIAFGIFHVGGQAGSPVVLGIMLVFASGSLIVPRLIDLSVPEIPVPPDRPPGGGSELPPAQEAALSVKDAEREKVIAVGHHENVARA